VPVCRVTSGQLEVIVDGQRTQLDFGAPGTSCATEMLLIGGLPEGTHEARLTVVGPPQGGQIAIDGLIVRHSPLFLVRRALSCSVLACLAASILYILWRHWAHRGSPG
jgi:hypothetical protein